MSYKKANILRAIFWGVITVILISAGVVGVMYNNEILNSRKDELESIIKIFENSKTVKNYESIDAKITAKFKGKNIRVTYNGAKIEMYDFKLKDGYLETNIDKNDSVGRIIVMVLADAIAVNYGMPEESTFLIFNDDNILKYKLVDGIEYKLKNNNTYNVKINLDTYLVNKYPINDDNQNIINNENDSF